MEHFNLQNYYSENLYKIIKQISPILFFENGTILYLSSIESMYNFRKVIPKYEIKTVISIMSEPPPVNLNITLGINHYYFELDDTINSNIMQYFTEVNNMITNSVINGENILVHCMAGISRSVTLVLSYLLNYEKNKNIILSPKGIPGDINFLLEWIRKKRRCANPNLGFIKQLELYRDKLNGL